MKFLSITISRKLFFIFLINTIITVTISGMVIFSFLGLSSQFNFNSELSSFKSILDSIRIEQSKLKGHAQSFYLNVTDLTVKDGLQDISDSLVFIRESLEKLKSDKNKTINSSSLASMHRFNLNDQQLSAIESLKAKYGAAKSAEVYDAELTELKKKLKNKSFIFDFHLEDLISRTGDEELNLLIRSSVFSTSISKDLDQIQNEIENLNLLTNRIAVNSSEKMTSAPVAKKNISNLINAFNEFKGKRKRIIFKLRAKRGLIAGKPEYETFMQKMMGGEADREDGYEKKEFLSKNLYYQLNQLIIGLDEIVTAAQDKGENSGSAKISDLEWMLDRKKLILYVLNDRGPECTKLGLQAAAAGLGTVEVQPVGADGPLPVASLGGGCGCNNGGGGG